MYVQTFRPFFLISQTSVRSPIQSTQVSAATDQRHFGLFTYLLNYLLGGHIQPEVGSIWNTSIYCTWYLPCAVFEILVFQIRIWNTLCIWYLVFEILQIEHLVFWYFKYFLSVDVFVQILHSKYFFQIISTYFQHATSSNHVEACVYLPCAVVLVQWAECCLSNVVM